jgi:hypothetical protein
MFPKFFYRHTFKSQVLQKFLGFIILEAIIKFLHYGLRIFAGLNSPVFSLVMRSLTFSITLVISEFEVTNHPLSPKQDRPRI